MKTRRQQGWVGEWLGTRGSVLFPRRPKPAKKGEAFRSIKFVESRPGDVVLSREQRETLAVIVKWMDDSSDGRFKVIVEPELRALLRGGR